MRDHKLFLLLSFVILFSGCAAPFVTHEYFSPSSDGGKTIYTKCRGTSGPADTIRFPVKSIYADVSASYYKNYMNISLSLKVPTYSVVIMSSKELTVISSSDSIKYKGKLEAKYSYPETSSWGVLRPIIGGAYKSQGHFAVKTYPKVYLLQAKINMPEINNFIVRMPEFSVNDVKNTLSDIKFEKNKSVEYFPPFNC